MNENTKEQETESRPDEANAEEQVKAVMCCTAGQENIEIIKVERYTDNGSFSCYELINKKTGDVLWTSGLPEESGRYLIIYKQGRTIKPFIADYDGFDGWQIHLDGVEILWWRNIPPYCT